MVANATPEELQNRIDELEARVQELRCRLEPTLAPTEARFLAKGDDCDEFWVRPSPRMVEGEIDQLLLADRATRADMAVTLLGLDITERKAAEQALRESEGRIRDLTACSSDWVWEVDAEGRYTFTAGRVREILGFEPEAMLGKTPFEFMPAAEAARLRDAFTWAAAAKMPI